MATCNGRLRKLLIQRQSLRPWGLLSLPGSRCAPGYGGVGGCAPGCGGVGRCASGCACVGRCALDRACVGGCAPGRACVVGCSCFPLGPLCPLLTLSLFSHFVLDLFETGMRTLKLSWQKCTQAHSVSVEGVAWETHLDSCGCSCPYCLNSLQ